MPTISRVAVAILVAAIVPALTACGAASQGKDATARATAAAAPAAGAAAKAVAKAASRSRAAAVKLPPGVVALAGAAPITMRALERSMAVQAIQSQPRPTRPLPAGVVPKPPGYGDCIAYLAKVAKTDRVRPAPSATQLKERCAQAHAALQQQVLEMLISYHWVREETAREGVALSRGEVDRLLRQQFPTGADLRRFLAFTGLRMSDERFFLENLLLREKWHRAALPALYARLRRENGGESLRMVEEIDADVSKLTESLAERWTPRTHCRAGYVVRFCSEYRR